MTEVGYSGYLAKTEDPNLLECNNANTNQKDNFNLFTKASIRADQLTIDLDVMQSQGPGYYKLDNQNGCECGLKEARDIQVSQPGINFSGGYGWIAEKGCLIDNDSELRENKERLTNKREINQLFERLSGTTRNLTKGYYDVDVESVLQPRGLTLDPRPCGPLSGVTIRNYFTPLIARLKEEVQDPVHIIPEDSDHMWVRGGLPTREMVRNSDYIRRCQEKTFKPS